MKPEGLDADWQRHADAIRAIRQAVFVVEQHVEPELEWDGKDATCRHPLVADAPDDGRAQVAQSIASATTQVRSSVGAHVALVSSGTANPESLGASAAAVNTAANQLATILGPEQPPAGPQQPPADPGQPPAAPPQPPTS